MSAVCYTRLQGRALQQRFWLNLPHYVNNRPTATGTTIARFHLVPNLLPPTCDRNSRDGVKSGYELPPRLVRSGILCLASPSRLPLWIVFLLASESTISYLWFPSTYARHPPPLPPIQTLAPARLVVAHNMRVSLYLHLNATFCVTDYSRGFWKVYLRAYAI